MDELCLELPITGFGPLGSEGGVLIHHIMSHLQP